MAKFDKSVLAKYGITGTTEVLYNPSYEVLFNDCLLYTSDAADDS